MLAGIREYILWATTLILSVLVGYLYYQQGVADQQGQERQHAIVALIGAVDAARNGNARELADVLDRLSAIESQDPKTRRRIKGLESKTLDLAERTDLLQEKTNSLRDRTDKIQQRTGDLEMTLGLPYEDHLIQ